VWAGGDQLWAMATRCPPWTGPTPCSL